MAGIIDTEIRCKDMKEKMKALSLSNTHSYDLFGSRMTIVEVWDAKEAKRAKEAGASVVSLLYRESGVYKDEIEKIKKGVSIPVMVMCRVGHTGEARILEAIGGSSGIVDYYIQETVVINPMAGYPYIDKNSFSIPFVCYCSDLKKPLQRVNEGASLLKIGGSSSAAEAVTKLKREITKLNKMDESEAVAFVNEIPVPYGLVEKTKKLGRLPVPLFDASDNGIRTPTDAVMLMELGLDGMFLKLSSSKDISKMVKADKHYDDLKVLPMLW